MPVLRSTDGRGSAARPSPAASRQRPRGGPRAELPRRVVVIDRYAGRVGHDDVYHAAAQLAEELRDVKFDDVTTHVAGEVGCLEWRAHADGAHVAYGADTFRHPRRVIRAQMLYYRVDSR